MKNDPFFESRYFLTPNCDFLESRSSSKTNLISLFVVAHEHIANLSSPRATPRPGVGDPPARVAKVVRGDTFHGTCI